MAGFSYFGAAAEWQARVRVRTKLPTSTVPPRRPWGFLFAILSEGLTELALLRWLPSRGPHCRCSLIDEGEEEPNVIAPREVYFALTPTSGAQASTARSEKCHQHKWHPPVQL